MAKFSNRVFGSNVDKTIIKVFNNLQKGSLDVEPLAESAPTHQDYIGDRTPFARMWSPALITGSADRKEVIYNVVNDNRDESYVEANESVGDLVFKELTDNRFLKPKAGITSISTKTEGALGALKNTTVEFMVHNKKDFDEIFLPFFLKPGATVVLDFGWSDKSFQPYEINGVIENSDLFLDDFKLFIYGGVRKGPNDEIIRRNSNGDYFYYPNENQAEGTVIYNNDPNVEGFVNQNKGLVESVVGKVTDYNASLTQQGSYQCSVNLKSENSSLLDSEITEDNDLKFVFANQIEEIIIQTLTSGDKQITNNDLILYDRLSGKEKQQVREDFYNNIDITNKALGDIPEKAVKSGLFYQNVLDDGGNEKNGQDILYIAYGLFEDLFLNGLISENKINKFHTVNYNTTDTFVRYENNLVLRQKAQLGSSEELPLFLMPEEWSNTSNGINKEFENQKNGLNLYNTPIIPFRDLFISVSLISKTFAQKQNVNDALDSILESINGDSYGVFRLKMKSTNDSFSSITFQDANLINVPVEKESELVFDITSGNSIVSNVDLKFEMPKGGLGSLIAIGEKGDYEFFDDENTDNLNFLRILNKDYGEDVHLKSLPLTKPKSPDEKIDELVKTGGNVHDYSDKSSKKIVKRLEIDIPNNIKDNWVSSIKAIENAKTNVEGGTSQNKDKPLREFKSKGDADSILPASSVRDYYGKLAKLNTVLQSGENTVSPILPLSLSLTIYGNTYLNIGDFISINFLPTEYRENIIFQIVNVEQKVDSNWQTTYETIMRLKPNKKRKIVDTKLKMPMLSTQYVTNFLNKKGNIGLFKNSTGEAISIPVDPVGMTAIRIDTYYNGEIEDLDNTETEIVKGLATPDSRVIPLQFEKPKNHEDFCFIYAFQKTIAQYIFNDAGRNKVTMLNVVKEENTSLRFDKIPISQFDVLFTALVEDAGDGTLGFFNEENGLIKFLEESTINSTSGNKVTAKVILQNTVKKLAKERDLNNLYTKYLLGNEEDYQQMVRVDSDGDGKDDILSYEVVGTGEKISKIDKDYGFVIPSYAFMHTQDKYPGVKYTYAINVTFKNVAASPLIILPGWIFDNTSFSVNDFCNSLLINYNSLLKETYQAFLREKVNTEQTTERPNPGYPFIEANYNVAPFGTSANAFEARQKLAQKFGFDGYFAYKGTKSIDDRKADWDNSPELY